MPNDLRDTILEALASGPQLGSDLRLLLKLDVTSPLRDLLREGLIAQSIRDGRYSLTEVGMRSAIALVASAFAVLDPEGHAAALGSRKHQVERAFLGLTDPEAARSAIGRDFKQDAIIAAWMQDQTDDGPSSSKVWLPDMPPTGVRDTHVRAEHRRLPITPAMQRHPSISGLIREAQERFERVDALLMSQGHPGLPGPEPVHAVVAALNNCGCDGEPDTILSRDFAPEQR